jgi:lysophospholipase L1-like esterase
MVEPAEDGSIKLTPPKKPTALAVRARWLLPRLTLFVVVFVIALKVIDLVWGAAFHSPQRYLLHLTPNFRQRHTSSEFDYEFRTNALGLRGPNIPFKKPVDTFRIALLGDSFVAGNGVSEANSFPSRLESLLNHTGLNNTNNESAHSKTEVINLGCTGISTIRALDLYETIGKRFHPDLVVLVYYVGNDLTGVVQEQTQAEFAAWRPAGIRGRAVYALAPNLYLEWKLRHPVTSVMGRVLRSQSAADFPTALYDLANGAGYDARLVSQRYLAVPPDIRQRIEQGQISEHRVLLACLDPAAQRQAIFPSDDLFTIAWPRTETHLNRLKSAAQRDGANFVLLIIPTASQIDREALEFNRKLGYEVEANWLIRESTITNALLTWAKSTKTPALDLTGPFRKSLDKLYFTEDTHLTPTGHAHLAELLKDFLERKVFADGPRY